MSQEWIIIPFRTLPLIVQNVVFNKFPLCVEFDYWPDKITSQIIIRSKIPCLHDNIQMFVLGMEVTLPDLYMTPCTKTPYLDSIYRLPQQPIHPHTSSNHSNTDRVCMCEDCLNMPRFPNEGFAFQSISSRASIDKDYQFVEFRMSEYSRFILPFTQIASHGAIVSIELPKSMLSIAESKDNIIKRTSFHKFLEFIRKRLNLDGKKVRSLRKVVARLTIPSDVLDIDLEIRFKRDAAGNLFLLFSNVLGNTKASPVSAVVSYHDLRMVCCAWTSSMSISNSQYLKSLKAPVYTEDQYIAYLQPAPRKIPQTMPPIFHPLYHLSLNSRLLITSDESKSPLHIMLNDIPSAVVRLIGQYCCYANTGSPTHWTDMDNNTHINPAYNPCCNNTITTPVAGPGMGTFSSLFLSEIYEPKLLDEIASYIFTG
jgi:hypothetical protein